MRLYLGRLMSAFMVFIVCCNTSATAQTLPGEKTVYIDAITLPGADNTDIPVENGRIYAPEGTRIYDIGGRLLPPDAVMPRGIYILILPDSTRRKLLIP